jgi:hypothetical protein
VILEEAAALPVYGPEHLVVVPILTGELKRVIGVWYRFAMVAKVLNPGFLSLVMPSYKRNILFYATLGTDKLCHPFPSYSVSLALS